MIILELTYVGCDLILLIVLFFCGVTRNHTKRKKKGSDLKWEGFEKYNISSNSRIIAMELTSMRSEVVLSPHTPVTGLSPRQFNPLSPTTRQTTRALQVVLISIYLSKSIYLSIYISIIYINFYQYFYIFIIYPS